MLSNDLLGIQSVATIDRVGNDGSYVSIANHNDSISVDGGIALVLLKFAIKDQ